MGTQPQEVYREDNGLNGSIPRAVLAGASGPALTILRGKEMTPYVLSRDELITRSARLARHFRDLGMEPEHRVLLMLPTDLAFLTSLMALWFVSAVSVPVVHHSSKQNHAMWWQKVRRILETSQPRFVIGTEDALAAIGTFFDGEGHPALISENEVLRITEEHGEPALPELPDENALAHCQFTSGSTGEPKGILVQHGQIVAHGSARSRSSPKRFSAFNRDSDVTGSPSMPSRPATASPRQRWP